MFAWMRYSEGLMIAHAALIVSLIAGMAMLPPRNDCSPDDSPSQKMVRLVCTCGLGFAVVGFAALLLAFAGWLHPLTVVLTLAICWAVACAFWKESPFHARYWTDRLRMVGGCWDAPLLAVYYLMLILAFPALNQANLGTDPLSYHLPYSADWAAAARLVVDPFLDPPFYASNYLMFDSELMQLGAHVFVMFLGWSTALLSALGVFAGVRWLLGAQDLPDRWAAGCAGFLTIAMIFAPWYFGWMLSAYIDVPIGAFALFVVLAVIVSVRSGGSRWLFAAAVLAGFLVGMKVSFLPFVFVFALAFVIAGRAKALPWRVTLLVLLVLFVTSSPWYVRNLVLAGDPIAPAINLMVYGRDGLYTPAEADTIAHALHGSRSPRALATLPVRAFADPGGPAFVGDGATLLIAFMYFPAAFMLFALQWPGRLRADLGIAVFLLCSYVGYWALSSTSLRYASLFYPTLALCLAVSAGLVLRTVRWRAPALLILCALTAIQSPGAYDYYHHMYVVQFRSLPEAYEGDAQYQSGRLEGYDEAQFASREMIARRVPGIVYVVSRRGENLHYLFRKNGITDAGGWFGPAGWSRLYDAVDAGKAPEFLTDLHVGGVLVGPWDAIGGLEVPLGRQLEARGFCRENIPASEFTFYVRCRGRSAAARGIERART